MAWTGDIGLWTSVIGLHVCVAHG